MTPILVAATLVLTIATLLPVIRHPHWLVRGMDFPRMQFAVAALLLGIAHCTLLELDQPITWLLIVVTLLCLSWQLWWIIPYTPIWPKEVKAARAADPESRLKIVTANVLTTNRNAEAFLGLVRQHRPDVLVTLESDHWWQQQLDNLQTDLPHSVKCPLDNLYGMHVYSRFPLEEAEISYLVEDDVPSIHALLVLQTGHGVRVHFLHPAPPSPTENPESVERDAELVTVARSVAQSSQPVIVTGDLNDVAWSATTRLFRKLSGLLDPRVGRGMYNTFHADYWFLRWPLDHLFHSHHFTVVALRRLEKFGSDHFALLATVTGEDRAWASSLTDRTNADPADVPCPGE